MTTKESYHLSTRSGFEWSKHSVGLVMAGEVFSESWRTLVCERLGARDPAHASASLYGTVCQYDPWHRFFEQEPDGSLLFSAAGSVPLVRYKILDRGGIVPYPRMIEFLSEQGFAAPATARALPFVFVFGRSNFAVSFYGANVYPENVAPALEQRLFDAHVTGKFVVQVKHDADHEALLEVVVELASGVVGDEPLSDALARAIRAHLERVNGEFASYVPAERRSPTVMLLSFGDADYFPTGMKHRYTRGE